MKNIVLKIQQGDLFRFIESEERGELIVGSGRGADISVRSASVQPRQVRLFCKNNVWYAEDLSQEDSRCEVRLGGKKFRKPVVKFDGELTLCKAGDKKREEIARISAVRQFSRKRGDHFDLTQKTVTAIGSGEGCDIRIPSPLVSEKHCFIVFDGESCYIEDAHSSGGTYVNNKKIKRQKLSDHDRISIPSAAYIFYRNRLLFSTSAAGIQIDAVGVNKQVNDRAARGKISLVTDVSFRIGAGEFVAIVGGSGAGKSTLLDCLNGMRPATSGKIYYDTNDYYENMNSYRGVVGYVPQRDILHEDLKVWDSLRYTAMLRTRAGLSNEELCARVTGAIADVRLQGKEHLRISSLSGGQKKRVSIAMELLSDPKVIFLDEPTSGLSPDLDMEMMELLSDLSKKGRTIVVITHAMENLDKCDRVLFLGRGGRVCYYGAAEGAFRWFNRRSYSRIFAALSDEETSESFAKKYRRSAQYGELFAAFGEEYGKNDMLPPEKDDTPAVWEKPPKPIAQADTGKKRPKNGGNAAQEATDVPQTAPNAAEGEEPEQKPKRRRAAKKRAENAPAAELADNAPAVADGADESVAVGAATASGKAADAAFTAGNAAAKGQAADTADGAEPQAQSGARRRSKTRKAQKQSARETDQSAADGEADE